MELIITLISGAIGGNVAGGLLSRFSQGTLVNSIIGIVGGGLGGSILSSFGIGGGAFDTLPGILSAVGSGVVGGGILLAVFSFVKGLINK